ncbi:hypothetical protein P7D22_16535 [Lichenihabitans sp. Uapishka_5]|uniref:hypothetical protein n=1 Tax=Lichenihabitans sp. Uapishka_5 TaxID=3037302 RepID=UPI0029E7F297|nr:hypothetical protein [Lichenihabitans sp. Uapishka_5]MDX7952776.1 hypothetical protein [Lichenihabitans sp. Uapishka_5]
MTKLLDQAFATIRHSPPETQDAVARIILDIVAGDAAGPVPPEHLEAVLEGEAQADRGEFASDAEVADAFRRFRG